MYYSLAQEKRKHSGAIMNCELALAKRKRRSNYELCIMNYELATPMPIPRPKRA